MAAKGLILWDFDGTLARREGLWSGCMVEVLDERLPGHGIAVERMREAMRQGYPWSAPEEPHPHLCEPEAWWASMEARMASALVAVGVEGEHCAALARAVRGRLIDPSKRWEVYSDALPALARTEAAGWRNAILSNHVPELEAIAQALGLASAVEAIFSSAVTGYEKPHPEAFRTALATLGRPRRVWMVGDNPHADVAGAEALGIPAILVRSEGEAERRAESLHGAVEMILAG
jgi:putative hydrolase of the HAD superfamily